MKQTAWQKEKAEHPWATKTQAKRIAKDHAVKKLKVKRGKKEVATNKFRIIEAAQEDFTAFYGKTKKITCGTRKLGEN